MARPAGRLSGVASPDRALQGPLQRLRSFVQAHLCGLYLVALTLVAAGLRLYGITARDIWYDEAFVITLARMTVPDMIRALIELDPHPPAYYLLMHVWLAVVGTDPLMARLPSAFCSIASVPLLYATGKRLVDRPVALAAATLLAFSAFHVHWAQEARMYSLLGLLGLGSTYFLTRGFQEGRRVFWALHALTVGAALLTHIAAVFYMASQAGAILVLLIRRRGPRSTALAWLGSQLVAGGLFLPWVPALLVQGEAYSGDAFARTTLGEAQRLLFDLAFAYVPYWRVAFGWLTGPGYALAVATRTGLVASSLLLAALGAWSLRGRLGGSLLPFLFFGAVSLTLLEGYWRGIVVPKIAFTASFSLLLLLAAGFAALGRRRVLVAGVAAMVLLNLSGIARYEQLGSQEEWRAAVAHLVDEVQDGEPVFVDASAGLMPLNYYLERSGHRLETHGVPFEPWAVLPPPLSAEDYAQVDALTANRPTIWLVVYRNGFPDPDGQLLSYLTRQYTVAETRELAKVQTFRLERTADTVATGAGAEAGAGGSAAASVDAQADAAPGIDIRQENAPVPAPTGPQVYFGAWVGERVNVPGDQAAFERAIGRSLAIVHRYSDNPPGNGKQFDVAWADGVRANGSIPMLSWQPGFGYSTRTLASVAAGERDEYIQAWADQLRDWGHPIFLRMMWEQNSSWYGWRAYQEPHTSDFIAAWRHIVDVFRARGVTNVTFVWSPNVSGNGADDIMETYPGDDYVDWAALDGYPFRGGRGDFAETFGPDYDLLVSRVPRPIMIAETSLEGWSDEVKAERIRQILTEQLPNRFPRVQALVWFEEKNTGGVDFSILQDQGPKSQEAFRQAIAAPYYAANGYGALATTPIPPPTGLAYAPSAAQVQAAAPAPAETVTSPRTGAAVAPAGNQAAVTPTGNEIVDASFEEGAGDGQPDAWSAAWAVPSWMAAVVKRDGGAAASGLYSMLHSSTKGESYSVYQEVPVVGGGTYDVSVSVLVESALRNGKASLEVQSMNPHGGVIETRPVGSWQDATDTWSRVEGRVKVAPSAVSARVVVRVAGLRGTFRLDDFSFSRAG
jgi:hypothetical protein